jgi:predicted NAD/FAD-dependent oxidoreductase
VKRFDLIVVGAGLSGTAAASDLARAGLEVLVLEKSRGVGGRAATRRWAEARLDHGAPFFTARGERFSRLVRDLEAAGAVRAWTHGFHTWRAGTLEAPSEGYPRYVATDGNSALAKLLRGDAEYVLETEATVTRVERDEDGYSVTVETASGTVETRTARRVILTAPTPQALKLTGTILEPQTRAALEYVHWHPCWALLARLERAPDVPWGGVKLEDHPVLEWVGLEHTKRDSAPALVTHANPAWTTAHLERPAEETAPLLATALLETFPDAFEIVETRAHRWRYARASQMHPSPYLEQDRLFFCGDWCASDAHGTRVENAVQSGWAVATAILETRA